MTGWSRSACTIANPMRWVKLTFPPRARRRWLLITTRLSAINLAGTARTLVAVGTASDASMFATTRAAAPRSGATVGSDLVGAGSSAAALRSALAAGSAAGLGVG
jgi:hypothetical protein